MEELMQAPNGLDEVRATFGNPFLDDGTLDTEWEAANIRRAAPPDGWELYYQKSATELVRVSAISMHVLVEANFLAAMDEIWNYAKLQLDPAASDDEVRAWLHQLRLDVTGGGYNFRKIRGANAPSMHAFGIAIDWDPLHNPQVRKPVAGQPVPHTLPDWWYDIWATHGWSDGRHFSRPDPMHVQFATGC